jgi:hypothetical protein
MVSQFLEIRPLLKAVAKVWGSMVGMSAPAAKARSEPVSTMQPMASSASNASSASPISSISWSFSAFNALGRFSVMRPVLRGPSPRTAVMMHS